MIINAYSYEKLIENYPEDKFILELSGKSEIGLYVIFGDPRNNSSGKIILRVHPVNIIK